MFEVKMQFYSCILLLIVIAVNAKLYTSVEAKTYTYNVSTHALDIGKGRPAANLSVTLLKMEINDWIQINQGFTEENGRYANFATYTRHFTTGTYKLEFDTKKYYSNMNEKTLYPFIDIIFDVDNPKEHYHIPILLNAYGYTTYRGS